MWPVQLDLKARVRISTGATRRTNIERRAGSAHLCEALSPP
jgi:hypothetical protein